MKNTFKRSGAALISLVLLLVLAVSAGAASSQNVGVKFWKERSDKESMANSGIDSDRTATLTRQANGTYTLTLPVINNARCCMFLVTGAEKHDVLSRALNLLAQPTLPAQMVRPGFGDLIWVVDEAAATGA